MPYSTSAEIRVQSPFKNATNIDGTYIDRKIAQADSIIDSAIGEVYDLPLAETPSVIQSLSESITILLLFLEQNTNIEVQPGVNVTDEWALQMELLEKVRTRKLKLYDSAGDPLAASQDSISFYPTQASTDSEETERKFTMNQVF